MCLVGSSQISPSPLTRNIGSTWWIVDCVLWSLLSFLQLDQQGLGQPVKRRAAGGRKSSMNRWLPSTVCVGWSISVRTWRRAQLREGCGRQRRWWRAGKCFVRTKRALIVDAMQQKRIESNVRMLLQAFVNRWRKIEQFSTTLAVTHICHRTRVS